MRPDRQRPTSRGRQTHRRNTRGSGRSVVSSSQSHDAGKSTAGDGKEPITGGRSGGNSSLAGSSSSFICRHHGAVPARARVCGASSPATIERLLYTRPPPRRPSLPIAAVRMRCVDDLYRRRRRRRRDNSKPSTTRAGPKWPICAPLHTCSGLSRRTSTLCRACARPFKLAHVRAQRPGKRECDSISKSPFPHVMPRPCLQGALRSCRAV